MPPLPRGVPPQLWDRGGYWTLEKRLDDVEGMEDEWDKLLAAFPEEPTLLANRGLGRQLQDAARVVHRAARRTETNPAGAAPRGGHSRPAATHYHYYTFVYSLEVGEG